MNGRTIPFFRTQKTTNTRLIEKIAAYLKKNEFRHVVISLSLASILAFIHFYSNGLGLAYNDARSHLDIGRRVVEGLKIGLAQLGSVWLPLPHFLMIFTVWNDTMWHTGLSGSLISMVSYVGTGAFIWKILYKLKIGIAGRLVGVFIFATNTNILYLQSTAMTELLLLMTVTAAFYELICYYQSENVWDATKASFWIMLSTLTRYEGWFIFIIMLLLITMRTYKKQGIKAAEGMFLLVGTLGGFGIFLWFAWNWLIFNDALYSFIGPHSAHAQQQQIYEAGELITKWNIFNSFKIYSLSLHYTIGIFYLLLSVCGIIVLALDNKLNKFLRGSIIAFLLSPLVYNVLALYFGFSIISIVHVFGDNWFNVRYGLMMIPPVAIFIAYFLQRVNIYPKLAIIAIILGIFAHSSQTQIPVTIQDALWGASSKNVSQVSDWLKRNAKNNEDKIFISAGSHDAIIFSSGLSMNRFIHEGTGTYWESAGKNPQRFARYIIMRTYDMKDATFFALRDTNIANYKLILKGEFADIYELKTEYRANLIDPKQMHTLNGKNIPLDENGLFLGEEVETKSVGTVSVFTVASMFSVVSVTLFLARVDKKPIILRRKINGEFGLNLTYLREARRNGLLSFNTQTGESIYLP